VARAFAWLGGAAFVGSLGYLIYFYGIVLAVPGGDTTTAARDLAINVGLFALFAVHHSVLARAGVKEHVARLTHPRAERSLYVWVASGLLMLLCLLWRPLPGTVYALEGAAAFVLYGVQALGALLTFRGAGVIDPLELAGIRQASEAVSASPLKIVGPFRLVRHPIYLGWMLMVFGVPRLTVNRLLFAVISSAYLILAIPWEERSLVAAHGDQYRAYQRTVRWRVIPGVW
jgi:protein-S-isoprenylcysteine O-methyltransferase Ste14